MADMYKKGVRHKDLIYSRSNPYPVSSEVLFKVLYKSQYNRKVSIKSINKLKQYFND